MTKYKIVGKYASFNPSPGILELTDEQYARRKHALKKVDKKGRAIKKMEGVAIYEIIAPTGFKHGEVIGFDGDVNKLLMQELEDIEAAAEEEAAQKKRRIAHSAEQEAKAAAGAKAEAEKELDSRSKDHGNDGNDGDGTGEDAPGGEEEILPPDPGNETKIPGAFFSSSQKRFVN